MQDFIIYDSVTQSQLACVKADQARTAVTWFLSTQEGFEPVEPSRFFALEIHSLGLLGGLASASPQLVRNAA